jgi:hypothetical protein
MSEPARRRIHPQRMQNAFMQVGEPDAEFRPWPLRLFARVMAGLLLVVVGLAVWVLGWFDTDDLIECLIFGVVLIGAGIGLAWKMWTLWGQRILLCPGGLVRRRGLKVVACRWGQIKVIREKEGRNAYEIVLVKGESWDLDNDHTQEIAMLAASLRERAKQHSVHWEMVKQEKEE